MQGDTADEKTMTCEEIQEIVSCLPSGKTIFHYFPDRYAVLLLARILRRRTPLAELKRSPFGGLLRKPLVAGLISRCGDGFVEPDLFHFAWANPAEPYLLGLTSWGEERKRLSRFNYHQTSRPGVNLVLQLNYSSHHDRPSIKLLVPEGDHPFIFPGHPVASPKRTTLAWARLDIDLDGGEALIEEIQSDWVREVHLLMRTLDTFASDDTRRTYLRKWYGSISLEGVRRYAANVLPFHARYWSEAMLSAAIWFLNDELGVRRIYYHTFEGGNRLKNLPWYFTPPRSLYTDLPRRFCFETTTEPPRLLDHCSDWRVRMTVRSGEVEFHRLVLSG
jgi:hypothetical protein